MDAIEINEVVKFIETNKNLKHSKTHATPSLCGAHQPDHFYSEELTSLPNLWGHYTRKERIGHGS